MTRLATASLFVVALVAGLVLPHAPAQAQLQYNYYYPVIGPPLALALDPQGNVLVTSSIWAGGAARLYSPLGQILGVYSQAGDMEAYGLACDTDGDVLVASYYGNMVVRFGSSGALKEYWPTGCQVTTFMAIDDEHNVYVTDPGANLVRKFTAHGTPITTWQCTRAMGIAYFNGVVYVVAREGGLISKFTKSGASLGTFGGQAVDAEQLAVGNDGRTYVADWGGYQLLVYRPDGTLEQTISSTVPGYRLGAVRFDAVAVSANGTVYAGDYANTTVLLFYSAPTPTVRGTWGQLKVTYR